MRAALAVLRDRVTYRRWAFLILGGALLMPYMMAGEVVFSLWWPRGGHGDPLLSVQPLVFAAVLPVAALSGLVLPVRPVLLAAATGLLGVRVEPPPEEAARTWERRRRTAAWFTVHLAAGGVVSGLTLALVPFALWLAALPVAGDPFRRAPWPPAAGPPAWWGPPAAVLTLALLLALVAGTGRLLARLAPALLGPSAADRLAATEARARHLASRNRLARELHDSVGHALSVVTVQAAAAGRLAGRDEEALRRALAAIEHAARTALEDLDHVLGVLRETRTTAPEATLADLDALLASSGAAAEARVGDLSGVPRAVSREAYRIVQEALTNALRHGAGPVRVAVEARDGTLHLQVRNPVRPGAAGSARRARTGGRGVAGMRERAALFGGELTAGFEAGAQGRTWLVSARLPLGSGP